MRRDTDWIDPKAVLCAIQYPCCLGDKVRMQPGAWAGLVIIIMMMMILLLFNFFTKLLVISELYL